MTEQTEHETTAVPARIALEDFIEAVTRGVARALAAEEEVSGYAAQVGGVSRSIPNPIVVGIIAPPPLIFPGLPDLSGGQNTTYERR